MPIDDDQDDEPTVRRVRPDSEDLDEATSPRAAPDDSPDTTPEVRGRYGPPDDGKREVELGRGGIGRVLLVRDGHLGRVVALKELLPSAREGKLSAAEIRFLREARVTAQLEHPGIVPVYELGHRDDGSLYYTMKQVRGRTLWACLQAAPTLRQRLRLVPHYAAVCQAMAYAHSRGVVHRDLKSQNVMVGEFGETVVLDWGLAKIKGQRDVTRRRLSKQSLKFTDSDATVAGMAVGTPVYMSPEQAAGKLDEVDERSDVWSLGAMLFELLTGRFPFEGKSAAEVLRLVASGPRVRDPRQLDRQAPPELCAIIEKAMEPDRLRRYASAVELASDVAAFEAGGLVRAHAYSSLELLGRFARRYRAPLISGAVALALLAAVGAWSVVRIRRERDAADQFATLLLTEVADTLEPVQGSAPVVDRLTRAALDFYGAGSAPEHLTPEQRERVANAARRLGDIALGVGQYDSTKEHLELARRLLGPSPEELAGQLQHVQIDLAHGDMEDELDRRAAATVYWDAAKARVEVLGERHADSPEVWHQWSRVEDRMGWVHAGAGRRAEAVAHFRRSNDFEAEAVRRAPENNEYLGGLVFGRTSLARQALSGGDVALAFAELEAARPEADRLLGRAPGVEQFQVRSALAGVWHARIARYAGRPPEEVAAILARARTRMKAIETQPDPSVDGVQVLVEVLLELGDIATAVARAQPNFARAPSVDRGHQLLSAQVAAGLWTEARTTIAWLEPKATSGGARAKTQLLAAVVAVAQGNLEEARPLVDDAVAVVRTGTAGQLSFVNPQGALAGQKGAGAEQARALLVALDGLQGKVDADQLARAAAAVLGVAAPPKSK